MIATLILSVSQQNQESTIYREVGGEGVLVRSISRFNTSSTIQKQVQEQAGVMKHATVKRIQEHSPKRQNLRQTSTKVKNDQRQKSRRLKTER